MMHNEAITLETVAQQDKSLFPAGMIRVIQQPGIIIEKDGPGVLE
jgi:hypothetical protein